MGIHQYNQWLWIVRELVGGRRGRARIVGAFALPGGDIMASRNAVKQWDQQYDLVIAGFGLASMCAAIEAHERRWQTS